jgi:hypothetical protein
MTVTKVKAFAVQSANSAPAPHGITRREPGVQDVEMEILEYMKMSFRSFLLFMTGKAPHPVNGPRVTTLLYSAK